MNACDGVLLCVACKRGSLSMDGSGRLRCGACGRSYSRRDGFVDLHPSPAEERSLAQTAMQSRTIVRVYESRFWRRSPVAHFALGLPFEREAAIVRESLALEASETVLDLACGSGIHTRTFARAVPRGCVVGLDLSRPMLAHAAERAARQGIDNALWVRGDAIDLPMADATFDAVVCCGALHLFSDVQRVLGEVRRVLEPSGRFVMAVMRRPRGPIGAAATRALRALDVSAFGEAELGQALEAAGFVQPERRFGRRLWMIWSANKASA